MWQAFRQLDNGIAMFFTVPAGNQRDAGLTLVP